YCCVVVVILGREVACELRQQVVKRKLLSDRRFSQPRQTGIDKLSATLHQTVGEGYQCGVGRPRDGRLVILRVTRDADGSVHVDLDKLVDIAVDQQRREVTGAGNRQPMSVHIDQGA